MVEDKKFWNALKENLTSGNVIPIVSNSFFINRLFSTGGAASSACHYDETIAETWAKNARYPFRDNYDLAEVAQYDIFRKLSENDFIKEAKVIKEGYLEILRNQLIQHIRDTDHETYEYAKTHSFWSDSTISEFCNQAHLPRISGTDDQGLIESDCIYRLINVNKVHCYLTTCYFDFIEQAFRNLKHPYYTNYYENENGFEYINENGESITQDRYYDPRTSRVPYIYHIFGHEKQPETMVMSEDDHINFLINRNVTGEEYKGKKVTIPGFIDTDIKNKTVLFLGYRWQDWEFRTIFRWIVGIIDEDRKNYAQSKTSVVVQFQPGSKILLTDNKGEEAAKKYLQRYFDHCHLDIQWEDSENFFCRLLQE